MIKSNTKAIFRCNIEKVWNIVTNNKDYSWRSDLTNIEIVDENTFIEYTKSNFQTTFIITKKNYLQKYEFDIVNPNIQGHWIGIFHKKDDDLTEIDFTEEITTTNLLMKMLAKPYLKVQQRQYIKDLQQEINNKK